MHTEVCVSGGGGECVLEMLVFWKTLRTHQIDDS